MLSQMCRLCSDLSGISSGFSTIDDQKSHAQFHLLQLGFISDPDRTNFDHIFHRCFPAHTIDDIQNEDTANLCSENEKSRSILLKRCLRVFSTRNNNSDPLICRDCGTSVRYIQQRSYINTCSILEHACSHLNKKPYGCRYCDYGSSRHDNIYQHLKRVHKIVYPTRNKDILERWAVDFDTIVTILHKCYDGFDQSTKMPRQNLLIDRRRLCLVLVRKYTNGDKKLECQLCRKAIVAQVGHKLHYQLAIFHIFTHLKKPIFKCTKCSSSFTSQVGANYHAKDQHKASSTNIIEDRSDKYHLEIMDLLTKCCDKKASV